MRTKKYSTLTILLALWVLCSPKGLSQESVHYIVTVGNETLTFVARPGLGYVVKARQDDASIKALGEILKHAGAIDIRPISGLSRKGVSMIQNERPAQENEDAIRALLAHNDVQYAASLFSSNGEPVAIIPEVVIRVKPNTKTDQVHTLCDRFGCTIIKLMEFTEQEYLIEVLGSDADAVFTAVEKLNEISFVEWSFPNIACQPRYGGISKSGDVHSGGLLRSDISTQDVTSSGKFPNDEYFSLQWHLYNTGQSGGTPGADIRAPEAWEITTGDPNIVIAVVDTGVDPVHPDLIHNLVMGKDFSNGDNSPDPEGDFWANAHGTNCAGLISAEGNNMIGVTGVAWNCKIMPIRKSWFLADGKEAWVTLSVHAEALRWAANHGADILSNSWYFGSGKVQQNPIVDSAIVDITVLGGMGRGGKGCVVFFCAGNDNESLPWTARYPEVITVGASDHDDVRCSYSNFGSALDIVAPSAWQSTNEQFENSDGRGALWTTDISGIMGCNQWHGIVGVVPDTLDYTLLTGTSGSTPIAAGVAALILSIEPDLTNQDVRHFLEQSAKDLGDPGWDQYYGWGRVDARAALDMVLAKRCDLNNNWKVDFEDLLILIEFWQTNEPSADIAPAAKRDGIVDEQDLELMMQYWQTEIPEMDPLVQ